MSDQLPRRRRDQIASDACVALAEVFGLLWRLEAWRLLRGGMGVWAGSYRVWISGDREVVWLYAGTYAHGGICTLTTWIDYEYARRADARCDAIELLERESRDG